MKRVNRNKIYLAGGFRSKWQEKAKEALGNWQILDPSTHNLPAPKEYTAWDLRAIRDADIILAYMELHNPGGYALALEIGYAKALGKKIILIEEHPDNERRKHFDMIREVVDHNFNDLESALISLNSQEFKV